MLEVGYTLDPTTGQSEVAWDITLITDVTSTEHRRKGKIGAHKRGFGKKGRASPPQHFDESSSSASEPYDYLQFSANATASVGGEQGGGGCSAESGWRMAVVDSSTVVIALPRAPCRGAAATLRVVKFRQPGSGQGGADEQSGGGVGVAAVAAVAAVETACDAARSTAGKASFASVATMWLDGGIL